MSSLNRTELLENPAFQRFAVETLLVVFVGIACFRLLSAPQLQSLYPAVFPQTMVRTTGRELTPALPYRTRSNAHRSLRS